MSSGSSSSVVSQFDLKRRAHLNVKTIINPDTAQLRVAALLSEEN